MKRRGMLVVLLCALSFSLKEVIICKGKVCPFSQISKSFLIFSYMTKRQSKWGFVLKDTMYGRWVKWSPKSQKSRTLQTTELKHMGVPFDHQEQRGLCRSS